MDEPDQLYYSEFRLPDLKESQLLVQQLIHDDVALQKLPVNLRLIAIIFRLYERNFDQYETLEQLIVRTLQDLRCFHRTVTQIDSKNPINDALKNSLVYHLSSLVHITKWSSKFGDNTKIGILNELLEGPASLDINEHKKFLLLIDYAITTCCNVELSKKVLNTAIGSMKELSQEFKSLIFSLKDVIDFMTQDQCHKTHLQSDQAAEELIVDFELDLSLPLNSEKQSSKLVYKIIGDNEVALITRLTDKLQNTIYNEGSKVEDKTQTGEDYCQELQEIDSLYREIVQYFKNDHDSGQKINYLSLLTDYLLKTSEILQLCKDKNLRISREFPEKLDFSFLTHPLSPILSALTFKNDLSEHEIVTLAEDIQSCLDAMDNEGEENYTRGFDDLKNGIRLLKLLPDNVSGSYVTLIAKPELIYEQMLMNREEDALKEASKFISYNDLIEKYSSKSIEVLTYEPNWNHLQNFGKSTSSSSQSHGDADPSPLPGGGSGSGTSGVGGANFNYSDTISDTTVISSFDPASQTTNLIMNDEREFVMPNVVPNKTDWVPDWKVSECMKCSEKFSLFNRRHHCRRCGRVICGPCSSKHLLVREISSRNPVRVCSDCYNQIKIQESGPDTNTSDTSGIFVSDPYTWTFSVVDEATNTDIRREFYYDCAPSVSLCLTILKLHSDTSRACEFLIESICKPLFEKLPTNQSECGLLLGMIEPLLNWVKMSLNNRRGSPSVRTASRMLAQVDLIRTLVNNSCNESVMSVALSPDCAPTKLLEKLLEAEYFDLALELSTKFGLDATAIWRTWAMQCLKNGCLVEAREKFRLCFNRARYSSDQIKSAQSKLLAEIVSILSKSDEKRLSLMQQITRIKQGIPIRSDKSREMHVILKPSLYKECLYYLEKYGTVQDQIQFYVTYCLWDKSLASVIKDDELDKLKLYKLASRTLMKNESSNIVSDFKLLVERIRQDLQAPKSPSPSSSASSSTSPRTNRRFSDTQIDSICDSVIHDFISVIREQDYQMEIAKMLSSGEAKIEFYIKQGKLSNAQRIACSLNRVDYVRRIIDEAARLNQNHVKTVCQLWLAKQTLN